MYLGVTGKVHWMGQRLKVQVPGDSPEGGDDTRVEVMMWERRMWGEEAPWELQDLWGHTAF